ncbi:amino acid ABC transporter permease [Amylibacter marinus]|uniref:Amino acid ABC transporter permease n=1 Tax=Amylibacter marinus TaxID=1475483 RepID=A0ABQ5VVD8_9RHOB|nr:amino acid ABC transporter permease [Amylibacter marinus]GLQ35129.1 amino acid ABC transporter permease [Amylibacter marinus]
MPDFSYVRSEMLPEKAPPKSEVGIYGWLRTNLFSSVTNSILTVVALYFVVSLLRGVLPWAFSPTWGAESLSDCRGILHELGREGHFAGACWGVIRERWTQLLFGFYPIEALWRPLVAFILLGVAMAPVLFTSVPKKLLWFSAVFPFLCFWLIWGGSIWFPLAIFAGLLLAGVAFILVTRYSGSTLVGVIATMLVPVLWWIFFTDPVSSAVHFVLPISLEQVESQNIGGFLLAVLIGLTGVTLSLPLGVILALGRQSDLPLLKYSCVAFIEFIRGVPLITLLFVASTLLNYFMPPGTNFDLVLRVMIMVTLFASAYMAEVIRGGLAALPTGQYEAADSLGLNYWTAQRLIIMPQALKISIPGIVSTFIGLFKDTTLVGIVGLFDPILLSTNIRADQAWNGVLWELYGFIGLVFFIFCFSMSRYSMYLERKLATGHR